MVTLTPREREVLALVAEGLSNKVIAYRAGCSEATIKAHIHNIMTKLKCRNRTQVALQAASVVDP